MGEKSHKANLALNHRSQQQFQAGFILVIKIPGGYRYANTTEGQHWQS